MVDRPLTDMPSWAEDGTIVAPSSGKQAAGWLAEERPPAEFLNWIQNLIAQHIQYLTPIGYMNLVNWTQQTNPADDPLYTCLWVDWLDLWIAAGEDDTTDAYLITSPDSENWTERANPSAGGIWALAHDGSSIVVGVGEPVGGDSYIISSVNGTAWAEQISPKNLQLREVAHDGSGRFTAVGNYDSAVSAPFIITSTNGTAWSQVTPPTTTAGNLNCVAYNATLGLWAALGDADGGQTIIYTSSNGTTWTKRTGPQNVSIDDVIATNNGFVAIGTTYSYTSADGITWTAHTLPTASLYKMDFDGFGVIAAIFGDQYIWTSPNGIDWTQRYLHIDLDTYGALGIAYGQGGKWLVVGDDRGTESVLMTSLGMTV